MTRTIPLPTRDPATLSVEEAAEFLGCSKKFIYTHAFDVGEPWKRCEPYHTLPGRIMGHKWRFHPDLLDQWMRGEYQRPDAPEPVTPIRRRSA